MIVDTTYFTQIRREMIWRPAALDQLEQIEQTLADLAHRHAFTAEVMGVHMSKSIELPVVRITTDVGEFTLRDNFHDVNLMAILKAPTTLTLAEFFADIQEPKAWSWYLGQVEDARGYSWRAWTDAEMDDPLILRVKDKRPGVDLWWDTHPDQKGRWARRLSDPAWYSHDWSSGVITWDGAFGPGVSLYIQQRAFAEGIDVTTPNKAYQQGINDFIIATDTRRSAVMMIERLMVAAKAGL